MNTSTLLSSILSKIEKYTSSIHYSNPHLIPLNHALFQAREIVKTEFLKSDNMKPQKIYEGDVGGDHSIVFILPDNTYLTIWKDYTTVNGEVNHEFYCHRIDRERPF